MEVNQIYLGNCIDLLPDIADESVDLVYLDPPFYTQRKHILTTRDESRKYEFNDSWDSLDEYLSLIKDCITDCKRILKNSGSIFLHCDKSASHHLRIILDRIFASENFRSEIIWSYKRWSNSKRGLLNSHQTIYFYSKTSDFKFNTIYTDYSSTTNIDQILQERVRAANGKSAYKKDTKGNVVLGKEKKGVPLSDVWEIPYLNPKAKERVGYPTQKPVLLLNQILNISTDIGDLVVDPFCGSGTTCVSAKYLNRNFIGIDISEDATELSKERLNDITISFSELLKKGQEAYFTKSEHQITLLKNINANPVQRNSGIDGFLKEHFMGKPVPVKIQDEHESISDSIEKLEKATVGKDYHLKLVIQTRSNIGNDKPIDISPNIEIIKTPELQILTKKEKHISNKSLKRKNT